MATMSLLRRLFALLPVLFLVPALGPVWPVTATLSGGAVQPESDATAAVWSKFGLVVQKHESGESAHTTETSGIIMRAPDLLQQTPKSSTALVPTALGKSWTQISVTQPPVRSSHLVTASTPVKLTSSGTTSTTTVKSIVSYNSSQDIRRDIPSRYQHLIGTSKPVFTITFPPPRLSHRQPTVRPTVTTEEVVTSKRVRQYEDDDDDDDDDEDEEDDDDEYDIDDDEDENHKVDDEEIEEIVEVQHVDSDGYGDEKPAIIKKKRRRKKKGKKSKPFKVKDFKKLKKFMLPLLLAYKLKFFTLVPLMLGGLVLIVATTGFAGFFFALFAVGLGLKGHH